MRYLQMALIAFLPFAAAAADWRDVVRDVTREIRHNLWTCTATNGFSSAVSSSTSPIRDSAYANAMSGCQSRSPGYEFFCNASCSNY
jgi:hypothetical protein